MKQSSEFTLSLYIASSAPDQDIIDTTDYDALGRVIRSQRLLDNRPAEQWETTLYGYDGLGRQVRVIRSASQPNYSVINDPSLSRYPLSDSTDQDIVTLTAYDTVGQVLYCEDVLGNRTWTAYDGLGRQVKTIVNPMGNATDNGVHDPRSAIYNPVINVADRDLISTTTYDSDGRVQYTQDVLGRRTWPVYDSLGRAVKNVTNASGNATDGRSRDPRSPVYARSINTDQDLISQTVYDAQGRVSATLDTRGNQTRYEYDRLGRRTKTITNYVDGVSKISIPDEDRIVTTIYDLAGRVVSSKDAAGIETRYEYDALGRQTKTIINYIDGRFNPNVLDEDLISSTTYNRAGQVVGKTDARGTQSSFSYDRAGRRLTVIQASGTPLATTSYTCYDKAGRVVRTIQNYVPQYNSSGQVVSPDAQDTRGNWLFAPTYNGLNNDTNLITRFAYDRSSRQIVVTDPLGNATLTTYFKDGQVNTLTDPEGVVTAYRYDALRRRTRVIQSYIANGQDPARWYWNAGWKRGDGTAIAHGANNDQNIIVDVAYDRGGRVASLRDPMGGLTTYTYDGLDRRTTLVNPINQRWLTAYFNLDFATRTVMTYPGVNVGNSYSVQRDFDRLGRLATVSYGDPATTPDVKMTYNTAGDRVKMTEYSGTGFTTPVRETQYSYDRLHRLTQAAFDTDGSGSIDESVGYAYDAGGLRTRLTLPGSLNLTYAYNAKGQLIGMTDWDGQYTQFLYDGVSRHVVTQRANGLYSRYSYDASGRLRELRHHDRNKTLACFLYQVDQRGNRTQAFEELARPATIVQTIGIADAAVSYYQGTWTTSGSYKQTTQFSSAMTISFTGNEAVLTMGTGTDQGIYDVYIDGSLCESFDGYSATGADRLINVFLDKRLNQTDAHVIDIRCRAEKNRNSSGYTLRFKQLVVLSTNYDRQTINYGYDALARLLTASYAGISPTRSYQYAFDRSGNRTQQVVTIGGTPTTTTYTTNAANQLTSGGAAYDPNGNMTTDGTNSYIWDRANRLIKWDDGVPAHIIQHAYDGLGNRTRGSLAGGWVNGWHQYLLDLQSGLITVLGDDLQGIVSGGFTGRTYFNHGLRGIQAQNQIDSLTGNRYWQWTVQDGLGSVRQVVDNSLGVLEGRNYDPYGNPFGATGTSQTGYGFTGELVDGSGLLDLRARRYNAGLGVFASRDPFEGTSDRAMSLNGYSWVEGNVVNLVDTTGLVPERDDIPAYRYAYSCNCGWLDTTHIRDGIVKIRQILIDLSEQITNWDGFIPNIRVIRRAGTVNAGGIPLYSTQTLSAVPDSVLTSPQNTANVAIGIAMAYEMAFEESQWPGQSSYFSQEDLPSDWLGFVLGIREWLSIGTITDVSNVDPEAILARLRNECDAMGVDESLNVFDQYDHGSLFSHNWREWRKKDRPSSVSLPSSHSCQSEQWPDFPYTPMREKGILHTGLLNAAFLPDIPNKLNHFIDVLRETKDGWYLLWGQSWSGGYNYRGVLRRYNDSPSLYRVVDELDC